jgi:hypothetical protein
LQRLFRALILSKTYKPLVYDLRPRFGRDVTAQIYCYIPGYFQVVRSPSVPHRIEKRDTTAAGDRYQRVRLRRFPTALQGLQMHPNECSYDFQMTQFFCPDVHEKVLPGGIFAVDPLN